MSAFGKFPPHARKTSGNQGNVACACPVEAVRIRRNFLSPHLLSYQRFFSRAARILGVDTSLVSFAAVTRVVNRQEERCVTSDGPNNGCERD